MIFHGKNSYAKAPQNITLQYTACIVFPYVQNLHQFGCTQHTVPVQSKVQSTLQNCGSSVCILLYVTLWRLEFCKPLIYLISALYDEAMYWDRPILFQVRKSGLNP